MNNIFLVPSAITSQYGVYTQEERFAQVLETIDSIRTHAPNSIVCLYDTSEKKIPDEYEQILTERVDQLVLLHDHPLVAELKNFDHEDTNLTGKKTFGELIVMLEFLHWLKVYPVKFDRVFKLSGRYRLNNNFNLEAYNRAKDHAVFSIKRNWYGDDVYTLRLWSFDYSQVEKITDMFLQIYDYVVSVILSDAKVRVIEFCVYDFIHKLAIPTLEYEVIGLEGCHGQDGVGVYE
jgi:hypothetical protein